MILIKANRNQFFCLLVKDLFLIKSEKDPLLCLITKAVGSKEIADAHRKGLVAQSRDDRHPDRWVTPDKVNKVEQSKPTYRDLIGEQQTQNKEGQEKPLTHKEQKDLIQQDLKEQKKKIKLFIQEANREKNKAIQEAANTEKNKKLTYRDLIREKNKAIQEAANREKNKKPTYRDLIGEKPKNIEEGIKNVDNKLTELQEQMENLKNPDKLDENKSSQQPASKEQKPSSENKEYVVSEERNKEREIRREEIERQMAEERQQKQEKIKNDRDDSVVKELDNGSVKLSELFDRPIMKDEMEDLISYLEKSNIFGMSSRVGDDSGVDRFRKEFDTNEYQEKLQNSLINSDDQTFKFEDFDVDVDESREVLNSKLPPDYMSDIRDNKGKKNCKIALDNVAKSVPAAHLRTVKSIEFSFEKIHEHATRLGFDAGGLAYMHRGDIIINSKIFNDIGIPKNYLNMVIAHEIGHTFHGSIMFRNDYPVRNRDKGNIKLLIELAQKRNEENPISEYSKTNTDELFAEAYAYHYTQKAGVENLFRTNKIPLKEKNPYLWSALKYMNKILSENPIDKEI